MPVTWLTLFLLNSPALQILKWAQSEFPGIHPGGVTDTAPLMLPARVDAAAAADSSINTSDG